MKRIPILLSSLVLLTACAALPVQPSATASNAEITITVQATLTAVAVDSNQPSASEAQPGDSSQL